MKEFKLNTGIISVMILATLFTGWTVLLLVVGIVVITNSSETVKNLLIKTIALLVGCLLFDVAWDIIVSGISVIESAIDSLFMILYELEIEAEKPEFLTTLFDGIIYNITPVISNIVSFAIVFAKFSFIINELTNKAGKKPFSKIDEYLNNVVNYINNNFNSVNLTNAAPGTNVVNQQQMQQAPVQAQAQVIQPANNNIN